MKSIKEQAETFELQDEILGTTEQWWGKKIGLALSQFNYIQEKLMQKWNEEDFSKLQCLEKEIDLLLKKGEWEKKEINKYQDNYKQFIKFQEKLKMIEFAQKIRKMKENR